jgi:hypothetical protein
MRTLFLLALLLAVGCDSSDLYTKDTRSWFDPNATPPADKAGQAPATGKTNQTAQ